MNEKDFLKKDSSLNGMINTTEHLTVFAKPKSDYEKFSHHEEFEIYWFLDGNLKFFCEGNLFDIDSGDILILAPRLVHKTILKNKCRYYRKHIKFTIDFFIDKYELYNRLASKEILKFNKKEVQELQLDKLLNETENGLSQKTEYGDFCALTSLSYFLKTAVNYVELEKATDYCKDGKASEIIRYIEQNLSSELNYKIIAEHFCTSEKNVYRIFKKETGFTLAKYITARRIIRAKCILNQGGTAVEASVKTGYKEYSVFYRNFIKETGLTPTDFISNSK